MRRVVITCLVIACIFSLPLNAQDNGLQLLKDVRARLGILQKLSDFKVYSMADCKGPNSEFTTLVISDAQNSRFEQQSGPRHTVGLRTASGANWHNVHTNEVSAADSASITFLIDHELHMIAFFPESRFGPPLSKKDTLFHGEKAIQLIFKDLKGKSVQVYYSQSELLPLGYTIYNHLGGDVLWIDTLFEDWKDGEDIPLVFTAARFLQGTDVYEYQFTDLRFKELPEGVFSNTEAIIK